MGDRVKFEIELTSNGKKITTGFLDYKILWDNSEILLIDKITLSDQPIFIYFTGKKMGFVQLLVSYEITGKKLEGLSSKAIEDFKNGNYKSF